MKLVRFLQLFFRISNNGLGQRAFYPRHQLLATRHSFFAFSCASSRLISCSTLDSGRSTGLSLPQKGSKITKNRLTRYKLPACHSGAAQRVGGPVPPESHSTQEDRASSRLFFLLDTRLCLHCHKKAGPISHRRLILQVLPNLALQIASDNNA